MNTTAEVNAELWVDDYGDALFGYALARVQDRSIAEDLVQETFLSAVRSRERFKGRSSDKTWLFAILKHKIIDHFRKSRTKFSGREFSLDDESVAGFFNAKGAWTENPAHWSTDPGKSQETKEFIDHFYRCLADLPRRNADAFTFREIDGLSTADICERLNISASNCWVILYRARMLLRRCLELVGLSPKTKGASS